MKKVILFCIMVLSLMFVINCGGPKRLTSQEYSRLTPQERIAYLDRQISKNPNDIALKKNLYKEYLAMGMPDKAIPVMKEILDQDPNESETLFDYGEAMMKSGQPMEAYRAFRSVLQSNDASLYKDKIGRYVGGKFVEQQVTNNPTDEAFPEFSPDGTKIVYQSNQNGNWDIVEQDLASGDTRFLLDSPADEELPCFNPTEPLMAYTSNMDDKRPIDSAYKVRDIYVLNTTEGYSQNLTESVAEDWLPRFSHDGKNMVFVSERSDLRSVPYTEKMSDIYTMESDGDFQFRLTPEDANNNGGACYSADDKHIFFHSNRNGSYDIFSMKSDGSNEVTIIGDPDANEVNPYCSPDSQSIVYFSDKNGNYDIYRAGVDGSNIEQLTFNLANDLNPVYSPDGKAIAFCSNRNGNYDIFIMNLEVQSQQNVSDMITTLNNLLGE